MDVVRSCIAYGRGIKLQPNLIIQIVPMIYPKERDFV